MSQQPLSQERLVGRVFGAPLVVKGWNWIPLNQFIMWAAMTWAVMRSHPRWSRPKSIATGGLMMVVTLGSEWLHNLVHAASAQWLGRPVDAVRIFMGMPLLVYRRASETGVTPREHILRAVSGPAFNSALLGSALAAQALTRPETPARSVAGAAVGMNALVGLLSMLPIPGIDGGSVLKWGLVSRGMAPPQIDQTVARVNRVSALGLGAASVLAFRRRRWLPSAVFAIFSLISLGVGWGYLKDEHTHVAENI